MNGAEIGKVSAISQRRISQPKKPNQENLFGIISPSKIHRVLDDLVPQVRKNLVPKY